MSRTYDATVLDLVDYSTLGFDIRQLEAEADYFGVDPIHLAQDMADLIAFRWNKMSGREPKFNEYLARLNQLHNYIAKGVK